jgi:hypothetical protein
MGAPMRSKGAALGGGRVADFLEGGAAELDGAAGQGGEVVEEAAEAAEGPAAGAGVGGGLGVGVRGAAGGGDGVVPGGGLLVGVGERCVGGAQVPGEVGGKHADEHVPDSPSPPG